MVCQHTTLHHVVTFSTKKKRKKKFKWKKQTNKQKKPNKSGAIYPPALAPAPRKKKNRIGFERESQTMRVHGVQACTWSAATSSRKRTRRWCYRGRARTSWPRATFIFTTPRQPRQRTRNLDVCYKISTCTTFCVVTGLQQLGGKVA